MSDEQIEAIRLACANLARAAMKFMRAVMDAMRPYVEAIIAEVRRVYQWATDRYSDAGAPYGDTHDGIMRWWQEQLRAIPA